MILRGMNSRNLITRGFGVLGDFWKEIVTFSLSVYRIINWNMER